MLHLFFKKIFIVVNFMINYIKLNKYNNSLIILTFKLRVSLQKNQLAINSIDYFLDLEVNSKYPAKSTYF